MKEIKKNENYSEILELLEKKMEFSCLWNNCNSDDGGCDEDVCSEVSCFLDFFN